MENRELIDRIYYLREKADNNKLAVFVGAGVSCNVQGMPSWAELVAKMAKEVGYVKCNNCRRKKDCESNCGHCEIIDVFYTPSQNFYQCLDVYCREWRVFYTCN